MLKYSIIVRDNTNNNKFLNIQSSTIDYNIFYNLSKDKKIIKSLNFFVLAQEAKLKSVWGPTLTPLIGKEKITDFCTSFNKESSLLYNNDVFIPVFFLLYDNKTFTYILRTPTFFSVLKYIYDKDKIYRCIYNKKKIYTKKIYYLTYEEIYYILHIKYSAFIYWNAFICLKDIINHLLIFNIKIIKNI
jgi:ribosomal protein L11